jgi:precorrin-3B methylase
MYTLTQTAAPLAIEEREYAIGPTVQFTQFTSCIGILSKIKGQDNLIGIHLSIFDRQNNKFNIVTAAQVRELLEINNCDESTTKIIGHIGAWERSNGFALDRLITLLGVPEERQYRFGDGSYGGHIENDGTIEIDF